MITYDASAVNHQKFGFILIIRHSRFPVWSCNFRRIVGQALILRDFYHTRLPPSPPWLRTLIMQPIQIRKQNFYVLTYLGCEIFDSAMITPVNQFFLMLQLPVFPLPFSILHNRYLLSFDRLLPRLRETAFLG
jgi:hypothetical protein